MQMLEDSSLCLQEALGGHHANSLVSPSCVPMSFITLWVEMKAPQHGQQSLITPDTSALG